MKGHSSALMAENANIGDASGKIWRQPAEDGHRHNRRYAAQSGRDQSPGERVWRRGSATAQRAFPRPQNAWRSGVNCCPTPIRNAAKYKGGEGWASTATNAMKPASTRRERADTGWQGDAERRGIRSISRRRGNKWA